MTVHTGWTADRPSEGLLAGLDVLAVDDDPGALEMVSTLLRSCGATVRTATSGREALSLLHTWRPHVLLSDLAMTEVDGYDLIAQIREFPGTRGAIPAIAITDHGGAEQHRRAMAAGFTAVVVKPFDLFTLVVALSDMRPRPEAGPAQRANQPA